MQSLLDIVSLLLEWIGWEVVKWKLFNCTTSVLCTYLYKATLASLAVSLAVIIRAEFKTKSLPSRMAVMASGTTSATK